MIFNFKSSSVYCLRVYKLLTVAIFYLLDYNATLVPTLFEKKKNVQVDFELPLVGQLFIIISRCTKVKLYT